VPQENVEIVRSAYDALHREGFDAYAALHDPDCEILPRTVTVEGRRAYRGYGGLQAFWRDIHSSFVDWLPEPVELRDCGDSVIVKVHFRAQGRDSGVTIDELVWQAVKFRGGRVAWWAVYPNEAEALEAIGLQE
jgi:ketosteroid isomerase-like protein